MQPETQQATPRRLSRKDVLKLGAFGGAALLLPLERTARTQLAAPERIPTAQLPPPFQAAFAVPPVLRPVGKDATTDYYQITQRAADVEILPGLQTQIYGYNGITPGPTIVARRGRPTVVRQINLLPETTTHGDFTYETTTSTHLHGSDSLPQYDGYANDTTRPGEYKDYRYPNNQNARSIWYHDHGFGHTSNNAYMGLAGFYVIHDGPEEDLPIPRGKYDLPIVIKDAIFATDGSLIFDDQGHSSLMGDVLLVNGKPWPVLKVEPRKYRFRLLNASISRGYNLALSSGDEFWVIGHDGGLAPQSVKVGSMRLGMAERYEIVVDFSNRAGQQVVLQNLGLPNNADFETTRQIMRFDVGTAVSDPSHNDVPLDLNPSNELHSPMKLKESDADPTKTQRVVLERQNGMWMINGRVWNPSRVDFRVGLDEVQIWELVNNSGGWFHPLHIHLIDFKILDRNGQPPHAHENGPKDVAYIGEGETVRVIAKWGPHKGKYMMHCHNLAHEDHDMMNQFEVGEGGTEPTSVRAAKLPAPPLVPGGGGGTNSAPVIVPLHPRPGSTVGGRRPRIVASVRDAETDLSRANMKLYVDGRRRSRFGYDRALNRLGFKPLNEMRPGPHTVRIVATDARGRSTAKVWRFRIR